MSIPSQIQLSYRDLDLTLAQPFGIARGTKTQALNVLVELAYKDLVGRGEAAPAPVHDETPHSVKQFLSEVQKTEIFFLSGPFGKEYIVGVMQELSKISSSNNSAKAAINMALWDLYGKVHNISLHRCFDLDGNHVIMTDLSIGLDAVGVMVEKACKAVDRGFRILKIKLGTDYDEQIIFKIREHVPPQIRLRVDANGGWSLSKAIQMSKFLLDQNIELLEQPLPIDAKPNDFEQLKTNTSLPIFADEPIRRASDIVPYVKGVDGVVLKLAKCGGINAALEFIEIARKSGIKILLGCMIESSLGITAACHLASLVDYVDLDGALLLSNDPFKGVICENGNLKLPSGSGLGVC